jgi:hypothetical protein
MKCRQGGVWRDVAAIGITNQRRRPCCGTAPPARPSPLIVRCRRTAPQCTLARRRARAAVRAQNGLVPAYSPAPSLRPLDNVSVPGSARRRAARFRHHRHVARLELDARRRPPHRSLEREPGQCFDIRDGG